MPIKTKSSVAALPPLTGENSFKKTWRPILAEFLGTLLFVYIGVGTAVSNFVVYDTLHPDNAGNGAHAILTTALAFGLAITALVYATAHTSGGHLNPAVTVGLIILGVTNPVQGILFILAQFLGAFAGAGIVAAQVNLPEGGTYATNGLGRMSSASHANYVAKDPNATTGNENFEYNAHAMDVTIGNACVFEFMGTFLLMFVVADVAVNRFSVATPAAKGTMKTDTAPVGSNNAPIAIGFAVFLAHCVGIPLTGCGINPARSFGSYIVSAMNDMCWDETDSYCHMHHFWIFCLMPVLGAATAALITRFVFDSNEYGYCAPNDNPSTISPSDVESAASTPAPTGPPSTEQKE